MNGIKETQEMVAQLAFSQGWWDAVLIRDEGAIVDIDREKVKTMIPEKIALIHSELSEALEDYRNGLEPTSIFFDDKGKPTGLPTELADAVIRIMDLAHALGIDLEAAILTKHQFNTTRPKRHGGKLA